MEFTKESHMQEHTLRNPCLPFNVQYQGQFIRISIINKRNVFSSYLHNYTAQMDIDNGMA